MKWLPSECFSFCRPTLKIEFKMKSRNGKKNRHTHAALTILTAKLIYRFSAIAVQTLPRSLTDERLDLYVEIKKKKTAAKDTPNAHDLTTFVSTLHFAPHANTIRVRATSRCSWLPRSLHFVRNMQQANIKTIGPITIITQIFAVLACCLHSFHSCFFFFFLIFSLCFYGLLALFCFASFRCWCLFFVVSPFDSSFGTYIE